MPSNGDRETHGHRTIALSLGFLILVLCIVLVTASGGDAAPDLRIDGTGIDVEVDEPTSGTTVKVNVTVVNEGDANASGFHVKLRDVTASKDIGTAGPFNLVAHSNMKVTFNWNLAQAAGGSHTIRATADPGDEVAESDETDNSADKSVTVNLPPTAKASSSFSGAMSFVPFTFSSSGSSDPDGKITNHIWYFGDGSVATGGNVTHAYSDGSPSPGRMYNVTLVVTDEDGGMATDTISVRVLNRPPNAVVSGSTVNTMTPISISGAKSWDKDGKVTKYQWTLHNGTIRFGSPLVVMYEDDGVYAITMTVWDDDGALASANFNMVVLNQAPHVGIKVNKTLVAKGESIRFDATASFDVDGSITNLTWIFGDQSTSSGWVVDHAYSVNGSFNVTLVGVDDDGAIAYSTIRVIVGNTAPFAVANADKGYVLTYERIVFNATSSKDDDDNIVSYAWNFGDGASSMGKVVSHQYTDDGQYTVTLTVTDSGGAFGISTITILVGNRAPVADFRDLTVMTGESAHFNGTYCWDMDGYVASYLWDLGAGLVYSTANASHSWERPGLYTIQLTVWDDDGATNSTSFNVTVVNQHPVAVVSASPLKTTLSKPVEFNGTSSFDPDGKIVNWTWSFGDGAYGHGERVSHTYTEYGTYLATLTVMDDSGGTNSSGIVITVRNQPPIAVVEVSATTVMTGEAVTFDGRNSTDPENQIADYFWSFGDGESATGPVVSHTFTDDSWFTVRLTVVDEDATAGFVEVVVKVLNRVPKAKVEVTPSEVQTLEDLTLSGRESHDDDGQVLWFRWEFGDGLMAYGETVTHAYANDGVYTVTLIVTDDDGAEASAQVMVTITNRAPVAVAGEDQTTRTGIPIRLDGRSSYDVDGSIKAWQWDFGDGSTAMGSIVTHSFPTYGTYLVTITVTDDDDLTSSANLTVVVENVEPVARIYGPTQVLSGEALELDGSSSYDLDGTIVDHVWNMGDGLDEMGSLIEHTYEAVGRYTITLTVEDDGGLKSSISMTVEVLNRRPNAVALASLSELPTGDTVELDGSGSSDPDGSVVSYTWIFGDGSVAYGAKVSHVYGDDGIYMVVLTVTDDGGGTDSTSLFIQVDNRKPLPAINGPEEALTLVSLDFNAEGTMDPDGTIVGYYWDFGDGDGANAWNVSHEYATGGTYTVRLTVMDDDGRTASTNLTVEVLNRAPVADAEAPEQAMEFSTVKFDASGSYDQDGLISSWKWDFGDGGTGMGREAYHKYLPGTYSWTLTVTDNVGDTNEFSGSIEIYDRPVVPSDGQEGEDHQDEESPGLGAVLAVATLALAGTSLAVSRRRRRT